MAGVLALAGWSVLVGETGPRSVARYVLYWSAIVYVPFALFGVPYLFTRTAWERGPAVLAAVGCAATIVVLFVGWIALALLATSTLTF